MKKVTQAKKLWGGRFSESTDALVEAFTSSLHFDARLALVDIEGSVAHVKMLGKVNILKTKEMQRIIQALEGIARDIRCDKILFSPGQEDIHMAVESLLTQRIGALGKKLHTGRSRNDQVNLDMRLYTKAATLSIHEAVNQLQKKIVVFAQASMDVVIPEMTHLQHAQPVLLSHHLLAYVNMLQRDQSRLLDCLNRMDVLPLGAGACSGTSIPIDQVYVAALLGFKEIIRNSADAVSDRDFIIELLSVLALIAMHLSRLGEEFVLWSSTEFGFISIGDAFCTGSSMMPQKKNPDVAEIIRGKTGRVYGDLIAVLTMMKGLPLTYNRDMQEDKEPLFDAIDTVHNCVSVFAAMIPSVTVNREACAARIRDGYLEATDVAEYLVMRGVPFRDAHHIVGRLVSFCIERSLRLCDVPLQDYKRFSKVFDEGIYEIVQAQHCVDAKNSIGGTSSSQVRKELKHWKKILEI